jgi:prepilin-type N-terminal cleavage/methylation domain-containing protein
MTKLYSSSRVKTNTSTKAGFTLTEIMIVVAIIGLLAAIVIPNFVKARNTSQANACINNLRQIDAAIQQYALENNVGLNGAVADVNIAPYMGRGIAGKLINVDLKCPGGGSYTIVNVSTVPTCDHANHTL